MTLEEAIAILDRAAAIAAGTRMDHARAIEAVEVIKKFVEEQKKP